ncbi:unnamed protein product [Camellia sinensis]
MCTLLMPSPLLLPPPPPPQTIILVASLPPLPLPLDILDFLKDEEHKQPIRRIFILLVVFNFSHRSGWIGHPFEYDGKDSDLVVRFCKDVESRSQTGYVDFGRFDKSNFFVAGSGHVNFVQDFYNGDLINCERSYDKMGRTAQGGLGCICNVMYESACRDIEFLLNLLFHAKNRVCLLGFEKSHHEFSFGTELSHVALYMTAIASLSNLVQKPTVKVFPEHGLEVRLSGSGATGSPPTTLSPTMLTVDWRCEKAQDTPYDVEITIPVDSYAPIQFTLTKMCEHRQNEGGGATRGWAVFGVISCVFIVSSILFCCGGFVYKTRVKNLHGLDALPGMTFLSACLETKVSGGGHGHSRPEDLNNPFVNQASWERPPASAQGTSKTSERTYGSI